MGCGNSKTTASSADSGKSTAPSLLTKQEIEPLVDKKKEREAVDYVKSLEELAQQAKTATDADIVAALSGLTLTQLNRLEEVLLPKPKPQPKSLEEFVALAETSSPAELEAALKGLSADVFTKLQEAMAASPAENLSKEVDETPLRTTPESKQDENTQEPGKSDEVETVEVVVGERTVCCM